MQDKQYFDALGFELISSFSSDENLKESKLIDLLRKLPLDILWETDGVHLKRSLSMQKIDELNNQ
jgi:hypothetical protein